MKGKPLRFKPGSQFEYSNTGYTLLGFIVEKASGKSLGAFLYERIWKPLGMTQTYLNDTLAVIPNRADGYQIVNGQLRREDFTSRSLSATGDGEVMSTAIDLAKWDAALYGETIVNAESKKVMFTPSEVSKSLENNTMTGYGAGYSINVSPLGTLYTHSGEWTGTSTTIWRFVSRDFCVVILTNLSGVHVDYLANIVIESLLLRRN